MVVALCLSLCACLPVVMVRLEVVTSCGMMHFVFEEGNQVFSEQGVFTKESFNRN